MVARAQAGVAMEWAVGAMAQEGGVMEWVVVVMAWAAVAWCC